MKRKALACLSERRARVLCWLVAFSLAHGCGGKTGSRNQESTFDTGDARKPSLTSVELRATCRILPDKLARVVTAMRPEVPLTLLPPEPS